MASFKFFLFSSVINIAVVFVGLGMLFFLGFYEKKLPFSRCEIYVVVTLSVLMFLVLGSYFLPMSQFNYVYFFKLLSLFALAYISFFLSKFDNNKSYYFLAFCFCSWGTTCSVLYKLSIIKPSGAGELSYLNLALPIGVGLISSAYLVFFRKNNFISLVYLLSCFLVSIVALVSLPARMVLLSTFFVLLIILIFGRGRFLKYLVIFALFVFLFMFHDRLNNVLQSDFLNYKIIRLVENIESEPRYNVYLSTLKLILDNPFGYGAESYTKLLGYYPHNIFLELALTSGILSACLLLFLLVNPLFYWFSIANTHKSFGICFLFFVLTYYLLQWMVSYDFSSSYSILVLMMIVNQVVYFRNKI